MNTYKLGEEFNACFIVTVLSSRAPVRESGGRCAPRQISTTIHRH